MKKYQVIYADPPWKQKKGGLRKCAPNQTRELDYPTMEIEDIKNLWIDLEKNFFDEQVVVFLWTIDKFLHEAENMMKTRGYKLHARIVWDKENGIAPAFTIRYCHEYLLWFYRGNLIPIEKSMRGKLTTIIREKSIRHSQKPIKAYEMIELLYPTQNKLELFARNKRNGWDAYGNEIESDIKIKSIS